MDHVAKCFDVLFYFIAGIIGLHVDFDISRFVRFIGLVLCCAFFGVEEFINHIVIILRIIIRILRVLFTYFLEMGMCVNVEYLTRS